MFVRCSPVSPCMVGSPRVIHPCLVRFKRPLCKIETSSDWLPSNTNLPLHCRYSSLLFSMTLFAHYLPTEDTIPCMPCRSTDKCLPQTGLKKKLKSYFCSIVAFHSPKVPFWSCYNLKSEPVVKKCDILYLHSSMQQTFLAPYICMSFFL